MSELYNVYCDESCHLKSDRQTIMVIGAAWCPLGNVAEIVKRLQELKQKHGLPRSFEVKWVKVSPAKLNFYMDVLDYFFDDDDLHFRALTVPNKDNVLEQLFEGDDDKWYYRLYYDLLKVIFDPSGRYRIFLDLKDTRGVDKIANIDQTLLKNFKRDVIDFVQAVRSNEVQVLQLADLLIGAVAYRNRRLTTSPAKQALVERMEERAQISLLDNTLIQEKKVNLYQWHSEENKE